jgi:Ca2+-binding RTX toxin-like protein
MTTMSGTTINGGSVPNNFSGASGASFAFAQFFNSQTSITSFSGSGQSTATGATEITGSGGTSTISGSAVADVSSGSNNITLTNPSVVFAAPNDTISAAGAATLFGGSAGTTRFTFGGADSSVTGGTGNIAGSSSGSNSTLVGGTGISLFSVTGANSLAVAGPSGITGINETASTGPETIATNPNGNSGTLVATLGSGADTVIGGSGASTITGGSGNDVFTFVKGHAGGTEVIFNYTKADNIAFAGYGYTSTIVPTETIGSFAGVTSDIMTLSDGTKITLVGQETKLF